MADDRLAPGEEPTTPAERAEMLFGDMAPQVPTGSWANPNMFLDTDKDGLPDFADVTPTGGEQYGWQTQQAIVNEAAAVANWPKNWSIKFNPPIATSASGAKQQTFGRNKRGGWSMQNENIRSTRGITMNPAGIKTRLRRKGYVVPDVTYSADWAANAEGTDVDVSAQLRKNSIIVLSKKPVIYGFKFMYNPATIDFSVSTYPGVNIGYLYSGKTTAMPTGVENSGSTIALSFPITRIDDMQFINVIAAGSSTTVYDGSSLRTITSDTTKYTMDNPQAVYGKTGAFFVDQEDVQGIGSRGTMYDLEFLFRAVLGRKWQTVYRGQTADVGLLFSVPLKLVLSSTMVYRVRISGVSFTHRSFTPDMVPIYTDVALSFERIPDVERII